MNGERMREGQVTTWVEYWELENTFDHYFDWQRFANTFVETTQSILHYTAEDIVLDIGCGPGYLAVALKDRVREIHCCDTSQKYLDMGRKNVKNAENVFFYKLNKDNYTDLSFLEGKQFSKIVCVSVMQYYDSITAVEQLIEGVRKVAAPGAYFVIADIIITNSILSYLIGAATNAIKRGQVSNMMQFFFELRGSDYNKMISSKGLLAMSVKRINEIIESHNLNAEVIDTQLTTSAARKHLLIQL